MSGGTSDTIQVRTLSYSISILNYQLSIGMNAPCAHPQISKRSLNCCPAEIAEMAESGLKPIDYAMDTIIQDIVSVEIHKNADL